MSPKVAEPHQLKYVIFPIGVSLNFFVTAGDDNIVESKALGLKESIASEDDKSFTFEVGRVEELSVKDTGNQWKTFPGLQFSELPNVIYHYSLLVTICLSCFYVISIF